MDISTAERCEKIVISSNLACGSLLDITLETSTSRSWLQIKINTRNNTGSHINQLWFNSAYPLRVQAKEDGDAFLLEIYQESAFHFGSIMTITGVTSHLIQQISKFLRNRIDLRIEGCCFSHLSKIQ